MEQNKEQKQEEAAWAAKRFKNELKRMDATMLCKAIMAICTQISGSVQLKKADLYMVQAIFNQKKPLVNGQTRDAYTQLASLVKVCARNMNNAPLQSLVSNFEKNYQLCQRD